MKDKLDCALEMDLMEHIKRLRLARNMSQSAVARKIGVTNAAVSYWEMGINHPASFNMWKKLTRAVGAEMVIEIVEK